MWQVVSWLLSRRTNVEVVVRKGWHQAYPGKHCVALFVDVANHSDHAVRVGGVALHRGRSTNVAEEGDTEGRPGASIPGTIPAHEIGQTWFMIGWLGPESEIEYAPGLDPMEPVWAEAQLTNGRTFRSKKDVPRHSTIDLLYEARDLPPMPTDAAPPSSPE